ncbi:hypothetical protein DESPIG_01080 [Desulfovibrio piger ATCC 29098]|uniref:Uncharacterized protein n=1 Tax=Desulfovibrio piger ATCC 29098 TaxID=411464 RepID=B6WSF8_9BACT|nr:hypothetical protein DESPIG_01080 [Desulfovibrio piger ATCC 29098]
MKEEGPVAVPVRSLRTREGHRTFRMTVCAARTSNLSCAPVPDNLPSSQIGFDKTKTCA